MEKFGIECKKLMAKEIKERLSKSDHLFISSFNKIIVPEQELLRKKLKEVDACFYIVKNRIAKQILDQSNFKPISSIMQGLTAFTTGGPDAISLSKALVDYAGKFESFKILGAFVDQHQLDGDSVKKLALIPPKDVLMAQVVFGLKAPIQGLVISLSATIRKFVLAIERIKEKQSKKGA